MNTHWAHGDIFGLEIPADITTLLNAGAEFLTKAFHASGTLPADNRVVRITNSQEFFGGGTGAKLKLEVEYESSATNLPERLFIKFSRNFDDELRDSARHMMISEARFAVLSHSADFPVTVPNCLFADVESSSATGLLITECIAFGQGQLEPLYPKCLDYLVPEPLEHYQVIIRELAKLAGTHRAGGLSPDFDRYFPYNPGQTAATIAIRDSEAKLLKRSKLMFEFVNRYPQLFPDNILEPAFQQQFLDDIPDVIAAQGRIAELFSGNPDFIALCHWNANIDNCWFWRDNHDALQCGFIDWAMVGQMSVAQSVSGVLSGAETIIWDKRLDDLLALFANTYASYGGPSLSVDELRLHILLLLAAAGLSFFTKAPVGIQREITDLDSAKDYRDPCFQKHENARIQLHMMTKMLNNWEKRKLGDLVRQIAP